MRPLRQRRRTAAAAALVAGLAALAAPAGATTGPGYLLAPPRHRISLKVLKAYTGRYATTSPQPSSRIQSSELYIGLAESGYAAGGISLYSYGSAGKLQSYAGTLYDFHVVGSQVEADIVGAGGQPVLGHLWFAHAHGTKNLTGRIQPPGTSKRYPIAYRYAASAGPLPGQASARVPGPPNSGVVSGRALQSQGASKAKPKPKPKTVSGWGPTKRFLGRYHLIPGRPATTAAPSAGIFSVALAAATQLSAAAQVPTSGELTMFMRTVKKTQPPEPSGILNMHTPSGNDVVYLTDLSSVGTTRKAQVHGGSFAGPQIGTFSGTTGRPGRLHGRLSAKGMGTLSVSFTRFSTNPTP